MTKKAFTPRLRFVSTMCAGLLAVVCLASNSAQAVQSGPVLFSASTSTRAIALEAVTLKAEPFSLTASVPFSADTRTRITLFCMNLDLLAGESASAFSADAQDGSGNHYPLTVEFVGSVPPAFDGVNTTDFGGIYMIVLRLNDAMTSNLGDVLVRLNLHGMSSNRVRVGIGSVGGGPADDPGAVPTPAPATIPVPVTPLTLAQYQAQFSGPSSPSLEAAGDGVRFLEQATWGPTDADLAHLRSIGIQAYLNEQFNATDSGYPSLALYPTSSANVPGGCSGTCLRDNYTLYPVQTRFFQNALTGPDQLRQRVAFALHQLIVVSGTSVNADEPSYFNPYLQTLDQDAFGNFRTILSDVTLNEAMGDFLNMMGNSQASPNENYAREIMQLFSVGVNTLNPDGTPVLDANGNVVPTYSQDTITNLARVFTGWNITTTSVTINGTATTVPDYITKMSLVNNINTYDLKLKSLVPLSNTPFPACANCSGGTTQQNLTNAQNYKNGELTAALDALFNHQNTGPYLCTSLISQLVTSNPSPAYVGRCAAAFNGGTRGDMKTVITAILLDPEARGDVKTAPNYGHLREPVLFMTDLLRVFNATSDGVLASSPFSYSNDMGQDLFNPPTVFSYYPAGYGLPGTTLVGPEFGLLDTTTTYKRANFVNSLIIQGIGVSQPNRPTGTQVNFSSYQAMATNPQQLVSVLNTSMMHGTMSGSMNANIVAAVTAITNANATTQALQRTQAAIYMIATSSQYQVER
jgi:uncharacterized protein (DUF1800 family)